MGHDVERDLIKKVYGEVFDKDLQTTVDEMSDAQVAVVYMRLKLQGKIK